MKYFLVDKWHPQAMTLQGIGAVLGTPAENVKIGDSIMWNYGNVSKITEIKKETAKTLTITEVYDGKPYERKLLKTRLICILQ